MDIILIFMKLYIYKIKHNSTAKYNYIINDDNGIIKNHVLHISLKKFYQKKKQI
jgi:hypothetical protein